LKLFGEELPYGGAYTIESFSNVQLKIWMVLGLGRSLKIHDLMSDPL